MNRLAVLGLPLIVGNYAGRLFVFILFILIAQERGDEMVGKYTVIAVSAGLLSLVIGLGSERWITQSIASVPSSLMSVLKAALTLHLKLSGVLLIPVLLLTNFLLPNEPQWLLGLWLWLWALGTACFNSLTASLHGLREMKRAGLSSTVSGLLLFVITIGAFRLQNALIPLIVAAALEKVLSSLITAYLIPREHLRANILDTPSIPYRKLLSISILNLSYAIYQRIDTYLLIPSVSFQALGQYSIAYRVLESISLLPASISLSSFPYLVAKETAAARQRFFRKLLWVSEIIGIGIVIVVLIASLLLPQSIQVNYSLAISLLNILIFGLIFQTVNPLLNRLFSALGRDTWLISIGLIAVASNVLFNLILIPKFGVFGAAYSTLASYACVTVAYLLIGWRIKAFELVPTSTGNT